MSCNRHVMTPRSEQTRGMDTLQRATGGAPSPGSSHRDIHVRCPFHNQNMWL